jgi:outer membrane protein OmpA-like peptidoglycan-associated protein
MSPIAKARLSLLAPLGPVLAVALAFCPAACERPVRPPAPITGDLDLPRAIQSVVNDLTAQMGPAPSSSRSLTIDPLLDGRTGQQTHASERVQSEFATSLFATMSSARILPFDGTGSAQSRLLVTGTLTPLPEPNRFRLSVALSDRQTGMVVAQAAAVFQQAGLDTSPTPFYGDSPSLVRDRSVEGYLRTAQTPAGKPADALYIEQVPTAALLADALAAYNAEQWDRALALYGAVVQRKDGQQLRTFNGIYLTNVRLGRMKEAEEAFAKIAVLGLATNNLAVKLLFRPGGTEFWPDPTVSGVYPMWLRQIARAAEAADSCLNIVGHTSHSGSEQMNERLSLARATAVRDLLTHEIPALSRKSRVSGVGFRENLIGTGADDASDALDRRVEFKVVACGGG